MKFQHVSFGAFALLLLSGCNEDVARNRSSRNQATQKTENFTVYSGIHREKGTPQVSYKEEIAQDSKNTGVRTIPDIRFDDDGGDGKNIATRTTMTRPSFPCGLVLTATLAEKLADCALNEKNGALALWRGTALGNAAEADWALVVLSEDLTGPYEVWLDKKTGMVWSDIVNTTANWCQASGSQLTDSDTVGVNCATLAKGQSLCTSLNLAELKKVTWRLPTRLDYLQADIDGIRFVLKPGADVYWSATTSTDLPLRDKAWTYNMKNGALAAELMTTKHDVRCIGTPNF